MKPILVLLVLLVGCGEVTDAADVDARASDAGAMVRDAGAVDSGPADCVSDPVTGRGYSGSVIVRQSDGVLCVATYSVLGGIDTLDCPCTELSACTAADRYLMAQAAKCGVAQ